MNLYVRYIFYTMMNDVKLSHHTVVGRLVEVFGSPRKFSTIEDVLFQRSLTTRDTFYWMIYHKSILYSPVNDTYIEFNYHDLSWYFVLSKVIANVDVWRIHFDSPRNNLAVIVYSFHNNFNIRIKNKVNLIKIIKKNICHECW